MNTGSNALSALCHTSTCGFVVTRILHAHWLSGLLVQKVVAFLLSGDWNSAF